MAPKSRQLAAAVSARDNSFSCRSTAASTASANASSSVIRIDCALAVMLGLSEQVGSDPVRIVVLVGNDKHFRGAGDHVDADGAEDMAFGGGDIGIARAGDLGDRGDRLRAIGKCGHGLRAADAIDLGDAGKARSRKHRRIDRAVHRRHHDDDPLDARDLGGDGVHQHRTRVACRSARHVKADRFDRCPARAEPDAEFILVDIVLRQLAAMVRFDPDGRDLQRAQHLVRYGRRRPRRSRLRSRAWGRLRNRSCRSARNSRQGRHRRALSHRR